MQIKKIWLEIVLVIVAAGLLSAYLLWPGEPAHDTQAASRAPSGLRRVRPGTPPVPGRDVPEHPPEPMPAPLPPGELAAIYAKAREAHDPQPGDKAFRANVDAFMKYNRAFAEDQAASEGITVDEVGELTYLGFLAQRTQVWSEVEEILGRDLPEDVRQQGEELLNRTNSEFKDAMRKLVADKAPIEKRWELIHATENNYKETYFALTGMNPELLDDLLAGDLSKPYAPSVTPPPDDIPENPDYTPGEPRPGEKPH